MDTPVTQLVVEVLDVVPASPLSVTQVCAEFLFANSNEARVTQLACELIVIPVTLVPGPRCVVNFPIDPEF